MSAFHDCTYVGGFDPLSFGVHVFDYQTTCCLSLLAGQFVVGLPGALAAPVSTTRHATGCGPCESFATRRTADSHLLREQEGIVSTTTKKDQTGFGTGDCLWICRLQFVAK